MKKIIKKISFVLILLVIIILVSGCLPDIEPVNQNQNQNQNKNEPVNLNTATINPSEATWQYSQSPTVQLGVRDKMGDLGSYTAVFVVTDPEGTEHRLKKDITGDDFGYVIFPDDFSVNAGEGEYVWKATVEDFVVNEGKFEYGTIVNYCDQVTVIE